MRPVAAAPFVVLAMNRHRDLARRLAVRALPSADVLRLGSAYRPRAAPSLARRCNVYRTSDDKWFLIVVTPDKWPALATAIGRPDLLSDARFVDAAKQVANAAQLTEILDQVFAGQPLAHWREALDSAHITFGVVRSPFEVIDDPQLKENDIVVPIEGAGENLKFTISSPMQVHDVTKVAARRAPEIGEHNDEVLKDLGFSPREISELRISGAIPQRLSSEEATA
jgi:crotonobetainyl-CoA:carnitine CoA-transferase CaiB-like acyl-CoA transferase